MATHSNTLAWKIPWTEEPGGLQPKGSQGVGHGWGKVFLQLGNTPGTWSHWPPPPLGYKILQVLVTAKWTLVWIWHRASHSHPHSLSGFSFSGGWAYQVILNSFPFSVIQVSPLFLYLFMAFHPQCWARSYFHTQCFDGTFRRWTSTPVFQKMNFLSHIP